MRAGNCAFSRDANANVFGRDVDVTGTTALVGAANAAAGTAGQAAAYVFDESDGVWTETEKLVASDGSANQNFGIAAGVSGSNTSSACIAPRSARIPNRAPRTSTPAEPAM